MLHTSKQFFFPLLLQCHVAMAILFVLSPHSHMLSVMLWMAFAGILASDSSPLILKITEVLEGMVVVAFRDFPSQLLDPRLYILTVTCKVPKREINWKFVEYFLVLGQCIQPTWWWWCKEGLLLLVYKVNIFVYLEVNFTQKSRFGNLLSFVGILRNNRTKIELYLEVFLDIKMIYMITIWICIQPDHKVTSRLI